MKKVKFEDLSFSKHFNGIMGCSQALMNFENGYGVSVVFGAMFYSNGVDTFELAVTKNGRLDYDNPVANGDVVGYLKEKELMKLINEVKNFKES